MKASFSSAKEVIRFSMSLFCRIWKNLSWCETLLINLLFFGTFIVVLVAAFVLNRQVETAQANPQKTRYVRTLESISEVDIIVISSHVRQGLPSDIDPDKPVLVQGNDFAFVSQEERRSRILAAKSSNWFVRPTKDAISRVKIPFYHAWNNKKKFESFALQVQRAPLPLTFKNHGVTVERRSYVECMYYKYEEVSDRGLKTPTWSGEYSVEMCSKFNQSSKLFMSRLNSTACYIVDGPGGSPKPNHCNISNFQSLPSWPDGDFYIIASDQSRSKAIFEEVQTKLTELSSQILSICDDDPKTSTCPTMQEIELMTVPSIFEREWPQGQWVSMVPLREVALQQLLLKSSSCSGAGCAFPYRRNYELKLVETPALRIDYLRDNLRMFFSQGTSWINNTAFAATMQEDLVHGIVTFTWGEAFALLASYGHTGTSIIGFLFPTVITVGFHFKFGAWLKNHRVRSLSHEEGQIALAQTSQL